MSSAELPSSLPKKSSAATSEARDVAKDGGFRPQGNYTNDDQAFSIYRHMTSAFILVITLVNTAASYGR
ncbi:hypothetical protein H634G_03284 [Metarhizium anisopliae BRIP 53293]|uniref:Uncharacterized protein n=1 Tax=Metarhizium anisopliae BRIP 53293 TaxID=1291518 RepID=A0A0D9P8X2_METAN|nr:hypothetical protein H634G_03284 [Metarhizium anisopliae BRIP 53293]KJK85054.1 hypothetical protein H633G_11113 [Metarhizium anisopliae BRIP 53284]